MRCEKEGNQSVLLRDTKASSFQIDIVILKTTENGTWEVRWVHQQTKRKEEGNYRRETKAFSFKDFETVRPKRLEDDKVLWPGMSNLTIHINYPHILECYFKLTSIH